MTPTLVVMVKEPHPGRVKTRLGRDIGLTSSAWWFRHQVAGLLRRIEDPRWQTVLAVAPDVEGLKSRVWPEHLPRVPQGSGNLGDRMARVFRTMPNGPVCIIGADIPGITRARVGEAFKALGNHDAVFGPAPDGGYWLVGMKRQRPVPPCLFEGVRWSTDTALADSATTMKGLSIAHVATLRDVDTLADLKSLSR
ncbi:TIGR04282 family arsenosugar biosynthesis glycosyltransferase [Cognatishimia activa]|uniref:TIGR04282 family arsenosugar biosynthesis glycosyltransferase n=1 Tax=Cognatishimia activa TaxID=1715691 RepID=A0A975ELY7_9RHOB|nr:TIGR04282 family arsenosugar biosynthesis glycosyltransferase [Cognatishimia activa]QTN34474.1 TIGR04282 family arsenosugar biosynthesis glycosyltransferase [Cognatishimia activa]